MSLQLSWDLHVHPGPSSVPRWGSGADIQAAAAGAGLKGFVWKSHDSHTARLAVALAPKPVAIGSASLNAWARPDDVAAAIADGARWVWGPTYAAGRPGWDLSIPPVWPAVAELLSQAKSPLMLATGHLGAEGRLAFAEFASPLPHLTCSITHSLYLAPDEVATLRQLGAVFEVDLYTGTRTISGRPALDLAAGLRRLSDAGGTVYLTTDCGQPDVGDPYVFSARILEGLRSALDDAMLTEIAVNNPRLLAERVTGATGR